LARKWQYTIQTNETNNILNLKKQTKMKNISKVLATAAIAIAFSNSTFAQATATASASATIITPITIVKNIDMNFGNVAVSASLAGTVVLAPAGTRSTGGAGAVSGQASYTYAITLPSTATLSDGASHTMTVNTFTSTPATTGTLSSGGTQDLKVGATLNVTAGQAANTYTNSTAVPVTVNYN
jgi:hypothetical protein